jgi:hypothetical protein
MKICKELVKTNIGYMYVKDMLYHSKQMDFFVDS